MGGGVELEIYPRQYLDLDVLVDGFMSDDGDGESGVIATEVEVEIF